MRSRVRSDNARKICSTSAWSDSISIFVLANVTQSSFDRQLSLYRSEDAFKAPPNQLGIFDRSYHCDRLISLFWRIIHCWSVTVSSSMRPFTNVSCPWICHGNEPNASRPLCRRNVRARHSPKIAGYRDYSNVLTLSRHHSWSQHAFGQESSEFPGVISNEPKFIFSNNLASFRDIRRLPMQERKDSDLKVKR